MEREAEQVRVLNRGILRFYPSAGTNDEADLHRATSLDKTNPQCVAHSNYFGVTVVTVPGGLGVTRFATLENATKKCVDKKDNNLDPLVAMPFDAHVSLPTTPHVLSLSPSQKLLAVAFDTSLAIYELARLVDANALPSSLINGADVVALSWSAHLDESGDDLWLAVLTSTRQIHVYTIEGNLECVEGSIEATSHCWSPCNSILAVGDDEGTIHRLTYQDGAFTKLDELKNPENTDSALVHHINWAEADLLFAGYRSGDLDEVEVTACLFEDGNPVPLDQLVDFFPNSDAPRDHAFYSCYLPAWRMFFVGCSLSTDIELLVSDPDTCEWQKWKPEEKYTPRLPMNAADEDTFPVGMTLILNSTTDITGIDDFTYAPCPLVLCATTEGLALNFALLDISVGEALDFLTPATDLPPATRPTVAVVGQSVATTSDAEPDSQPIVFDVSTTAPSFTFNPDEPSSGFGQDTDNVFNEDSDDDDDDDEEERANERAKASAAFDAVDTRGKGSIPLTDFEKLFDALGTVYSAEEHTKTIRKLDRKGVVRKDDFLAWYVDWVMADIEDDDSDDDDGATHGDDAAAADTNTAMKSDAEIQALRERFRPPAGSWKCDACMVLNTVAGAAACVSCETPNPAVKPQPKENPSAGFAAFAAPPGEFKGFSFGVPSTSTSPATVVAPSATAQSGGFSFGVPASAGTSTPSFDASGVGFGAAPTTSTGGFSFGVSQTTPPQAPPTTAKATESTFGNDTDNVFISDEGSDDSDDEEEERKEEEAKASAAFDQVDTAKSGKIPAADFEKLFDALKTVYSADEHTKTLAKLNRNGFVLKHEFLAWYVEWVFSDLDDDEEEANAVPDFDPTAKIKSAAEIQAAFDKFKAPAGSWKCSSCLVMNPDEKAARCAACEAPNPNAPASPPAVAAPSGAGAISFGVSAAKAPSSFSFGVPASAAATTAPPTFDFGKPAGATPTFSFGVSAAAPSAAPDTTKPSPKGGYGNDTDNVFPDDDSDDDDEEEEREEELKKANDAFDQVDTEAAGHIPVDKFESLFDALGTVYSADEHKKTLKKLARDGLVWKADFVGWYIDWIFAELSDDDEDDDEATAAPDFDPNAKMKSKEEIQAVLDKFKQPSGSWKCDACMVSNPDEKATKCIACETPNPNAPSQQPSTTTSSGFGGVASQFNGFGFGVPPDATKNSFEAISFGAGNAFPTTKGFTFPVPAAATKAPPAGAATNTKSSGYPPDTSARSAVAFGASTAPKTTSAYPPDTSSKPVVAFGATATPSAPGFSFGVKATSAYPPDTSSKPAVALGTSAAPKTSSAYPPDTSTKPAVAFGGTATPATGFNFSGAKATPAYPPDTSTKPAVAFGTTAAPKTSSAYPPDTSSKPAVAFGSPAAPSTSGFSFPTTPAAPKASSAYPPDTSTKPAVAFGATTTPATGFNLGGAKATPAYPPDTSTKPAVAFGTTAAPKTSSAYPPDTSTKPAVAFGATAAPKTSSAYPPDTSSKPAVAFGATATPATGFNFGGAKATSAYPPDTSLKPAVAFGTTAAPKTSSAYPPDTSTKPVVAFGTTATPATGFNFGGAKAASAYPPDTSSKPAVAFGTSAAPKASSAYPPDTSTKPAVAFGSSVAPPSAGLNFGAKLAPTAKAPVGFGVSAAPKTGPSLKFESPSSSVPPVKLDPNSIQLQKAMPATALEGEMWNLINVFDRTFQSIRRDDAKLVADKSQTETAFIQSLKDLRSKVLGLCDTVDKLSDSFNVVEADVKAIVGNCSDVEVQIECSNNLLKAMNDKNVIAHLEDQPLDKRSQTTRTALRSQLESIDRMRIELEKHVGALKGSVASTNSTSKPNDTAQLFRVLKLNYDTSKREYTRVLELANSFKQLEVKHQVYTRSLPKPAPPVATKDLLKQLRQQGDAHQAFRSNLAKWTSQPIEAREVSAPVKRRPLRDTIAPSKPAPEVPQRVASKLMFGAKTTIPSQATETAGGVTFAKPAGVDVAAKAPVDTEKAPKSVSFSASTKPGAFGFGNMKLPPSAPTKQPNVRPNLSFATNDDDDDDKPASPRARKMSTSSRNSTPDRSAKSPSVAPMAAPINVKPLDFGAKPKDSGMSAFSFTPTISKPPAVPTAPVAAAPSTTVASAPDFIARLKSFYAEYAPGKSTAAAEKMIAQNAGKEEEVFHKLLQKYVSKDATVAHAKEYSASGKVPDALKSAAAAAPVAATSAPSPFGATAPVVAPTKPSPCGATPAAAPAAPSSFGTTPAASTPGPFGATTNATKPSPFGATPAAGSSPFGAAPAATGAASSPFGATTTASPSPFGATTTTPPAASPFGAAKSTSWPSAASQPAAASPFGASSTSFGVDYRSKVVEFYKKHNPDKVSEVDTVLQKYKGKEEELLKKLEAKYSKPQNATGGFGAASPFGATPATPPAFGATSSPFGATPPAASGFGSASPFGATAATPSPGFGSSTSSPFGAASSPGFNAASPFGAPAQPSSAFGSTTGGFGASGFGSTQTAAAPGFGGTAAPAFGAPTALGGATSAPTFGAPTALGGATAAPAFGATTSLGGSSAAPAFGGGGFGAAAKFGAPSSLGSGGGGFSSFAANTGTAPSFGFGGQAAAPSAPAFGGGGGGFGSGGFASSSFTQARR